MAKSSSMVQVPSGRIVIKNGAGVSAHVAGRQRERVCGRVAGGSGQARGGSARLRAGAGRLGAGERAGSEREGGGWERVGGVGAGVVGVATDTERVAEWGLNG